MVNYIIYIKKRIPKHQETPRNKRRKEEQWYRGIIPKRKEKDYKVKANKPEDLSTPCLANSPQSYEPPSSHAETSPEVMITRT